MKTRINVSYQVPGQFGINPRVDKRIRDAAALHKGDCLGSGSGFGQRDSDFEFPTKKAANLFVTSLAKFKPALTIAALLMFVFILSGCDPSPEAIQEANQINQETLKKGEVIGITEDNFLLKRYRLKVAGSQYDHYVYLAIPYLATNMPTTITVNHQQQAGKSTFNQVEVIINGVHMSATPDLEKK